MGGFIIGVLFFGVLVFVGVILLILIFEVIVVVL